MYIIIWTWEAKLIRTRFTNCCKYKTTALMVAHKNTSPIAIANNNSNNDVYVHHTSIFSIKLDVAF